MREYTNEQAEAIDRLILQSSQRLLGFMDEQGIVGRPGAWDAVQEEIDALLHAFLERLEEIMAKEDSK